MLGRGWGLLRDGKNFRTYGFRSIHQGVVQHSHPEAAVTVDGTIIGPHSMAFAFCFFLVRPEPSDILILGRSLLDYTDSIFPAENEDIFASFDFGRDTANFENFAQQAAPKGQRLQRKVCELTQSKYQTFVSSSSVDLCSNPPGTPLGSQCQRIGGHSRFAPRTVLRQDHSRVQGMAV